MTPRLPLGGGVAMRRPRVARHSVLVAVSAVVITLTACTHSTKELQIGPYFGGTRDSRGDQR
jgi:hypothetical protein